MHNEETNKFPCSYPMFSCFMPVTFSVFVENFIMLGTVFMECSTF